MSDFNIGFFNEYELRARVLPAIIAAAPGLALAVVLVTWTDLGLSDFIIGLALIALILALADLARRAGKRKEAEIFEASGGKPSTILLRHRDLSLDSVTKARLRNYLGHKLDEEPPSAASELQSPTRADEFYERCVHWLISRTRDTERFRVLFTENITYGFRRNLYGLRPFGLAINVVTLMLCATYLYKGQLWLVGPESHTRIATVSCFVVLHLGYLIFFATKAAAVEAAKEYGRRLMLSCETVMKDEP